MCSTWRRSAAPDLCLSVCYKSSHPKVSLISPLGCPPPMVTWVSPALTTIGIALSLGMDTTQPGPAVLRGDVGAHIWRA